MQRGIPSKGRRLPRWVVPMGFAVLLFAIFLPLREGMAKTDKIHRPDVIYIDTAARTKTLEMAPAVFQHDKHTAALAEMGKDCAVCHTAMDSDTPFAFMGLPENADAALVEKGFHDGCLSCHYDLAEGPQDGECRTCHAAGMPYENNAKPMQMSASLHYQHIASDRIVFDSAATAAGENAQNCGACHHVFDTELDTLVWAKGKEEACSACHGETEVDGVIALQTASHEQCVQCHALMNAEATAAATAQAEAGQTETAPVKMLPQTCASCHTAEAQNAIPVLENVPRLERGQPDMVILHSKADAAATTAATASDTAETPAVTSTQEQTQQAQGLEPVLFNHKAHEQVAQCSVCHHTGLNNGGCSSCHTPAGKAEGGFIQLSQAMHDPMSERSCVGCHQQTVQNDPTCAGCHAYVQPMEPDSCGTCHSAVPGITDVTDDATLLVDQTALQRVLEESAAKRSATTPIAAESIPEVVIIDDLMDEYEAVKFPHRKIYAALQKNMADNGLAKAFHNSPEATCAACHHNSPSNTLQNPPACVSCHGAAAETLPVVDNRPSLKAAYHQQCMTCHERMDVKPVAQDCAGCHAPRNAEQ